MKKIILLLLFIVAASCKNETKKEEYVGPKEIENKSIENISVIDTLNISNPKKWKLKNISIDSISRQNKIAVLNRVEWDSSSYIISNAVDALPESHYRVTVLAKKSKNSALGLRLTAIYPNRADAVYDLELGKVIGTNSNGEFSEENAEIEVIDDNWFKCTLTSKVDADKISVFFGPTASDTKVTHWESGSVAANDAIIKIDSIILEEIIF